MRAEGLILCCCAFMPSRLPTGPRQQYIQRLGPTAGMKNSSINFTHRSLTFTGVKMSEIWPQFSTTVAFEALWFRY